MSYRVDGSIDELGPHGGGDVAEHPATVVPIRSTVTTRMGASVETAASSGAITRGRAAGRRFLGVPGDLARRRDHSSVCVERRLTPAKRLELRTGNLVAGVVARPNQRGGLDVLEAELEGLDLHLGELVGVVVALERQMTI